VAAQIAAGEVVERPASVAKELIENALDAGATRINVEVRGGGLQELKIQDNGSGIPAAEVELAFERHATSKLRAADDLWAIATLGFRGEALPSIASVSQLICVTRTAAEELGTELRIAGGELQSRSARGCSPGTTFSIRNLFYNATVRREFLRSEATEASAITAVVTQYALAYPEVRFTMLLDGRLAVQTSGRGDLREALIDLYGLEVARQLLPVEAAVGEDREAISVRGLVSPPGLTRSSRGYIHLFVNRRAIQPRGQIAMVIEEAYHTLMMKGRHPVAALDIRVHPGVVDVNVHPTKSEVKFRDNARVMSVLGRAIRAALIEGGGVRPWDDPATPAPGEIAQRRFELRRLGDHWERDEPARRGEQALQGFSVGPCPQLRALARMRALARLPSATAWRRSLPCCAPWLISFWRSRRRSRSSSTASTSPLRTTCPGLGRPRGPGSMRPAFSGCTLPPAFGSISTLAPSSTVRGSSAASVAKVRTPSWRCAGLGRNTLPSGWRCGPLALGAAGAPPWS